jgi:hypothetical protein
MSIDILHQAAIAGHRVLRHVSNFSRGEKAQHFYRQGYRFTIRPLALGEAEQGVVKASSLLNTEKENDSDKKTSLVAIQHMRMNGWQPSAQLGAEHGDHVIEHARASGFGGGRSILCELDASYLKANPENVMAYCQAWFNTVHLAGYKTGLYDGSRLLPLVSLNDADAKKS